MNLNKVMLIGRLTQDPEARTTPNGQNVTSFSVATNRVWTDQSGQRQEKSEFHNIVTWRKLAEIMGKYLVKGQEVYLEGSLQTRSWDGKDGVKRYRTEIVADKVEMGSKPAGARKGPAPEGSAPQEKAPQASNQPKPQEKTADAAPQQDEEEEINIEDIPF